MGIPRDRCCKGHPDRDGPVASVQRQEEARRTPESARAFQKEGGLNTGKEVAKDVLDVSDTLCQIRLTKVKNGKKKPKAKPIREKRPTLKQPKRQAMVLVPAALER